ncbi:hypothetical protein QE152_g38561 [Popillia japonica]|uniref:DUF8207 domain-containing protein n=1 Tax=Popillia japonica TaxID=7064 RepID=A0AAW1HWK8_POPJA
MNEQLTSEIIKATKAIKKKQLAMKIGQSEQDSFLQKHFKPITEPLRKILKTGGIKQEIDVDAIKSEITHDLKRNLQTPSNSETSSSSLQSPPPPPPSQSSTQPTPQRRKTPVSRRLAADVEYNPFTEEEEEEIQAEKSFRKFREEYRDMIDKRPDMVDKFLKQYNMTPRVYIDGLLSDTTGEYDTTTGVHFDHVLNQLKMGNAIVEIDGNDLIIQGIRYKGTAGLYELIFKSEPKGYTKEDQTRYRDRDINELVERLKLLIASQQAGHTGHNNEIASIIEELKEAGVI